MMMEPARAVNAPAQVTREHVDRREPAAEAPVRRFQDSGRPASGGAWTKSRAASFMPRAGRKGDRGEWAFARRAMCRETRAPPQTCHQAAPKDHLIELETLRRSGFLYQTFRTIGLGRVSAKRPRAGCKVAAPRPIQTRTAQSRRSGSIRFAIAASQQLPLVIGAARPRKLRLNDGISCRSLQLESRQRWRSDKHSRPTVAAPSPEICNIMLRDTEDAPVEAVQLSRYSPACGGS